MMLFIWIYISVITLIRAAENVVQLEKSLLEKILHRYDSSVRPNTAGNADSPTKIRVNMFVIDIFEINDFKMEYNIHLYLRQFWNDPRLSYPDPEGIIKSIPVNGYHRIWTPDLFFNEREGKFHYVMRSNRFVRIYPHGNIFFSTRLSLKLYCPMDFKYFPFDKQICSFQVESYGFTTKDITLSWKEGTPIQANKYLHMSNFILEDFAADYCSATTEAYSGGYSCLQVNLLMKRQYGFYLTQIFIPFVIMVAISWMSFWLDQRALTLRLPLLVILIFIMVMLTTGINTSLPAASYIKAIDIWTAVSLSFVFAALLEFILVNQLNRRERKMQRNEDHVIDNGGCIRNETNKNTPMKTLWKKYISPYNSVSKKIDFTCRVLFPTTFVIFNCIFWLVYIRGRDNYSLST